jgi:hypothetical protein
MEFVRFYVFIAITFLFMVEKVKLKSLRLTKHHAMKTLGSGGIAPRILDFGIRWRWVVSFTPRPLYPQGKSPWYPLDRRLGEPQSRSGRDSRAVNNIWQNISANRVAYACPNHCTKKRVHVHLNESELSTLCLCMRALQTFVWTHMHTHTLDACFISRYLTVLLSVIMQCNQVEMCVLWTSCLRV